MSTAQEVIRNTAGLPRLHFRPPVTPSQFLRKHRLIIPSILGLITFLAVAAAIQGGALLKLWDKPVQQAVEGTRTPTWNGIVHAVSQLGGHTVVVAMFLLLFVLVRRRCQSMAIVLTVATLARPLLEFTLKATVDRPRPDLERLVPGNGPSFPSGHVLAAVALWGLLPPIIGLLTNKRFLWWCSVVLSALIIGSVAASRVYLGVHWFSDVVGGLLVGSLYLIGVERLLEWTHKRKSCTKEHEHQSKKPATKRLAAVTWLFGGR